MKLFLMLDYDGTLAQIRRRPGEARLSLQRKKILQKLANNPKIKLAIISGRKLSDVKKMVGIPDIIYIGNHGFEIEFLGKMVIHPKALEFSKNLNRILENIKDSLGFLRGFEVEHKKYTASLHYRGVPIYLQQRFVKKIKSIIMPYLKNKEAVVTYGKKVIELRPPVKWNKGNAVLWILSRFKSKKVLPVYIGDDKTDEDAFKAIGNKGLTFYVGTTKPTSARYKLKNVDEVYKLLKALSPSMPY